jgi:uncharacterized protein (DUF433 family)
MRSDSSKLKQQEGLYSGNASFVKSSLVDAQNLNLILAEKDYIFLTAKRKPNMNSKDLLNRITVNPKILVGKPTIRGLRISVEQILNALAAGVPEDDLLKDYPELEADDIRAALAYAASIIAEEQVYPLEAA